ncbi:MAG: DMT family transporter [Alphaproteobacteria bacterium]
MSDNTEHTKGILFYTIGMFSLPVMDLILQHLLRSYPLPQVGFARFTAQGIFTLILIWYFKNSIKSAFTTGLLPKFLIGITSISLTMFFFTAIKFTSVSVALCGFFMAPLFTPILSGIFFKQKPTIYNVISVIIGFIAVLIVARPGMEDMNIGALFAVGGGMSWSVIMVLQQGFKKVLSKPAETQVFVSSFCAITYLIAFNVMYTDIPLIPSELSFLGWVIATGVISGISYVIVQKAVQIADAASLAPLQYLELVAAMSLEFILYSIIPDTKTWIGASLIVISGFLVLYDAKRKKVK